ncbi:MAG: hypothetical protein GXY80_12405 [Syntrophorhabdus aromaticivorans]|uniref:Mor transcription activator domain-containing protein n=1 Tax=Syntrophorhabdus aromaticivorans TaxID=328301 RepID=A0A971S2G4_9BACT|nr:hypothetical protein [Syntrophorhabdus aromaticivorans]
MSRVREKPDQKDRQETSARGRSCKWLEEIEIEDLLDGDMKLVYKYCGIETLVSLFDYFCSMSIYVSGKDLNKARKRYIRQHFTGNNVKSLCVKLGVSERFIYDVLEEKQTARCSVKIDRVSPKVTKEE